MSFQIGDIVSILNQVGKYTVLEIQTNRIKIVDEIGFDQWIDRKYLVHQRPIKIIDIPKKDEDDFSKKIKTQSSKNTLLQIDLHFEALFKYDITKSAHEKFILQLNAFKKFTNEMIDKRQTKFRIIHGAGEGKLKNEIRGILSSKKGFAMHDDQYSHGKIGASIIEIKLSVAEKF